jgi:hypothetical protein
MATTDLQDEFTRALESHLADGGEAALLSAYELGRRTLAARFGVLDVATLLHEALLVACLRRPDDSVTVVREAGYFALECLSPFEMAHRAVREANAAMRGLNDHLEEQTRRISRDNTSGASLVRCISPLMTLPGMCRAWASACWR